MAQIAKRPRQTSDLLKPYANHNPRPPPSWDKPRPLVPVSNSKDVQNSIAFAETPPLNDRYAIDKKAVNDTFQAQFSAWDQKENPFQDWSDQGTKEFGAKLEQHLSKDESVQKALAQGFQCETDRFIDTPYQLAWKAMTNAKLPWKRYLCVWETGSGKTRAICIAMNNFYTVPSTMPELDPDMKYFGQGKHIILMTKDKSLHDNVVKSLWQTRQEPFTFGWELARHPDFQNTPDHPSSEDVERMKTYLQIDRRPCVVFQGLKELGYSGVNHYSKNQGDMYNVNGNLKLDTVPLNQSKLRELKLNMDLYEFSDDTMDYNLFNNKLVIIDEVHELWNQMRAMDGRNGDGAVTYSNVQRAIRVSKSAKVIGLTATPFHKFRKESYQEELYRAKYKNDPTFMDQENADPYRLLYRLIGDVEREKPVHGYVSYYYGYPSGRENKYAIPGVYDPSFPIVLSLPLYGKALDSQSTFKNLEAFYKKCETSDHKNSFSLRIYSIASFLRDVYQWEHPLDNGSGEKRSKTLVLARDGEIKILKKLLTQSLGVGPIDKNNPMTPGRSKWAVLDNPEQMTDVQKRNTTKLERTINGPGNAWGELITLVLAPMAQYSTGHDFKAFDALILTHVPTTGYTTLKQAIGRVTRLCAHRNLRPDIQPSVHKMIRVYMFASVDVGEWDLKKGIPDAPDEFNHSLEWKEVVKLVKERKAYTSDHSKLEDISVHKTLLGPNMQRRQAGVLKVRSIHPYFMLGEAFLREWKESNISANPALEKVNRAWTQFTLSHPEKSSIHILNAD